MMRDSLLLLLLAGGGCAMHAQPLLPGSIANPRPVAQDQSATGKRFLILPFEDARDTQNGRAAGTHFVPIAHLFYSSREVQHPEATGFLRAGHGWHRTAFVGAIEYALPQLLGAEMSRMQVASLVDVPAATGECACDSDYVISGRVLRTNFRDTRSIVLGLAMGVLGVPYHFVHYDLFYEVSLLDARDPGRPIFQRSYAFTDSSREGLYSSRHSAYPMFLRGFEQTLPIVVADLAAAVARHELSEPHPQSQPTEVLQ